MNGDKYSQESAPNDHHFFSLAQNYRTFVIQAKYKQAFLNLFCLMSDANKEIVKKLLASSDRSGNFFATLTFAVGTQLSGICDYCISLVTVEADNRVVKPGLKTG